MSKEEYVATIKTGLIESRALPSYDISIEGVGSAWAVNRFDKGKDFKEGDKVLVVSSESRDGYVIIDKI